LDISHKGNTATVKRLNTLLKHVVTAYSVDTPKFVSAGYDFARIAILRFVELRKEHPTQFVLAVEACGIRQ
jgi:hypothetical protein